MPVRKVTHVVRGERGEILALIHPDEHWSPRSRAAAIADIESCLHVYYVQDHGERREVEVVQEGDRKVLRAPDDALARLPSA